jgi:hypothetical protein
MSPNHLAARAGVQATTGRVGEADRYNPGIGRLRRLAGRRLDAVRIHRRSGDTP